MLFTPSPAGFAIRQKSFTGRLSAAAGTVVYPSVGSKSSWQSIVSTVDHDTYGVFVFLHNNAISGTSRATVVDIGIDPAGGSSYSVLIPDLVCGGAYTLPNVGAGVCYYFPVFIPAGSSIAARSQSTQTTSVRVLVDLFQAPVSPVLPKFGSYVEAIGMSSVPNGVTLVPGTTSKGSWTLVGTTSSDLWYWEVGFQLDPADSNVTAALITCDVAVGDGTSFTQLIWDAVFYTTSAEACSKPLTGAGFHTSIPAGSSIYARAQSSNNTLDQYTCAVYGVGG